MGSKAYESPLISHARMRAIYRGLVELQALAEQRKDPGFHGAEACWVAAAIDLREGDLVCDTGGSNEAALLEHVRAVGRRPTGGPVKRSELKRLGRGETDGFPGSAVDRLLCAVGSAMALRTSDAEAVVLAFARTDALNVKEWTRLFKVMGQEGLPLVVMALPGSTARELEAIAKRAAPGKKQTAVPVIPVDSGDAIATYRVTQETMVRARTGGGAAVIEGLVCGTEATGLLGRQLVKKRVCTERWVQGVKTHVASLLTG